MALINTSTRESTPASTGNALTHSTNQATTPPGTSSQAAKRYNGVTHTSEAPADALAGDYLALQDTSNTSVSTSSAPWFLRQLIKLLDAPQPSAVAIIEELATIGRRDADADALAANTELLRRTLTLVHQGQGDGGLGIALNNLGFGWGTSQTRTLAAGARWLGTLNAGTTAAWASLIAARAPEEVLGVIRDPQALAVLQGMQGDPRELIGRLAFHPPQIALALEVPEFKTWVQERIGPDGLAQLEQGAAQHRATVAETEQAYGPQWYTSEEFKKQLRSLPDYPGHDDATKRRLHSYMLAIPDGAHLELWSLLFEKRFGMRLREKMNRDGSVAAMDKPALVRTWEILEKSPDQHVDAIFEYMRTGTSGFSGLARGGAIEASWDTARLGSSDYRGYGADGDPTRGINPYDAVFRHELGHVVGNRFGFDKPGGMAFTEFGWERYDSGDPWLTFLREKILPQYPLVSAPEHHQAIIEKLKYVKQAEGEYAKKVEEVQPGLWERVKGDPLFQFLIERTKGTPWLNPHQADGRRYQPDTTALGATGYVSVPEEQYSLRITDYSLKSPQEWFAEYYAFFYATVDQPGVELGHMVKQRNPKVYQRFMEQVHPTANLAAQTGQLPAATANGPTGTTPTGPTKP